MNLELSDEEAAVLARHLRHAFGDARFPYAPRLDPLKAIPPPPYERPQPLSATAGPSHGCYRRRR